MTSRTIAVDARLMFDSPRRGIGKTSIELYRTLAQVRPHWTFELYYRAGRYPNPFPSGGNLQPRQLDLPGYRLYGPLERWVNLWESARLPWRLLTTRPDIFHIPGGLYPPFTVGPLLVTIHDVIPIDLRPNDEDVKAWAKAVRRSAHCARAILTASEHAKGRICDVFNIPPEKVHLVQWGPVSVPSKPLGEAAQAALRVKYQLPQQGPYLLHFGLEDPRKNTANLLAAYAKLPAELRQEFPLLVIGFQGPGLTMAKHRCESLGLGSSVRLFGYVPEEDGQHLLAGAALLCYPSLYEGYGLPMVEAFQLGVPVLASRHSSIPQVAGEAAYLVDASEVEQLAEGLKALLEQPALRQELADRGRRRAASLSWQRCAEDVASVFELVLN